MGPSIFDNSCFIQTAITRKFLQQPFPNNMDLEREIIEASFAKKNVWPTYWILSENWIFMVFANTDFKSFRSIQKQS